MRSEFVVPTDLEPLERQPNAAAPGQPIRSHHPTCFGCGADAPAGLHLVVTAGDGFDVTAELVVEPRMEGGPGVIHGGLLATAFDEVMGTAPLLIGSPVVTAHMEVDYLAPVPVGSTLYLSARILGRQRRKIYTEGTAHVGDPEAPVGIGHAIFVAIDLRKHFAPHLENSQLAAEAREWMSRP